MSWDYRDFLTSFLGAVKGGLRPALTNLLQWHKTPSEDGLTLPDSSTGGLSLAEIVDVPCLSFDGVDDNISVSTTFIGDFYWSAWVRRDETGTQFSLLATTGGDGIRLSVAQFQWRDFAGTDETISHTTNIAEDIFYFLEMERVGTDLTLTVDGVAETSTTASTTVAGTKYLGNTADARTSAMSVSQVTYRGDSSPYVWNLEEGQGTTAYDSSGNGYDRVINGATWTTADGIPSRNRKDGFSLDGAVRIPALADGSGLDAKYGLPLTNPATGPDNGSGTKTKQTAPQVIQIVTVSGLTGADAVQNGEYPLWPTLTGGKVFFTHENGDVLYSSGRWLVSGASYHGAHADGDTPLPPASGYPVGSGGTSPTVTLEEFWVDTDGEFVARTQAEIDANNDDADAQRSAQKLPDLRDSLLYSEAPTGDELDLTNAYIDSREA
jgi:hypothetical protein